ncbi:unnamed protein product [Caretta caretta]
MQKWSCSIRHKVVEKKDKKIQELKEHLYTASEERFSLFCKGKELERKLERSQHHNHELREEGYGCQKRAAASLKSLKGYKLERGRLLDWIRKLEGICDSLRKDKARCMGETTGAPVTVSTWVQTDCR